MSEQASRFLFQRKGRKGSPNLPDRKDAIGLQGIASRQTTLPVPVAYTPAFLPFFMPAITGESSVESTTSIHRLPVAGL